MSMAESAISARAMTEQQSLPSFVAPRLCGADEEDDDEEEDPGAAEGDAPAAPPGSSGPGRLAAAAPGPQRGDSQLLGARRAAPGCPRPGGA
eukprot:12339413-Heterocapsa_arctica.AAC.1